MKQSDHREIVAAVAKKTGVAEHDVEKVLKHLGIESAMASASGSGLKVSAEHAKLAFKTSRNSVTV
ncbi:MAG TPA: hypothetical protein VIX89_00810 [Bryobacteraceae bacterium]